MFGHIYYHCRFNFMTSLVIICDKVLDLVALRYNCEADLYLRDI